MKICKDCKIKQGYEFTAVGCHTVRNCKCDECGEVKSIWPSRHFRLIKTDTKTRT